MDVDETCVKKGGEMFNGNPSTAAAIVMCHACGTENDESVKGFAGRASHSVAIFLLSDIFRMLGVALRRDLSMFLDLLALKYAVNVLMSQFPPTPLSFVGSTTTFFAFRGVPCQLIRA